MKKLLFNNINIIINNNKKNKNYNNIILKVVGLVSPTTTTNFSF